MIAQATSLRLMSLSALLSYTADDSNERIFEVSAAAEILRSIISVSFAGVVADFVMAEHETLWSVVDPRVYRVVKKLREMTQMASAKAKNDATVRLKVPFTPSPSPFFVNVLHEPSLLRILLKTPISMLRL